MKHLSEPPPPVDLLNPAVTPELTQIVNKLLSKEPAARYRTAGQLARILHSYQQAHGSSVVTPMRQPAAGGEMETAVFATTAAPTIIPLTDQDTKPTAAITPEDVIEAGADITAVSLGIIAIIALLGLIPLWFMVYRAWAGG